MAAKLRTLLLLSIVAAAHCGKHAAHPVNPNDPFSRVAGAELDAPCTAIPEAGTIPAIAPGKAGKADANATDEVVAYLAHPYDEGFFIGGTLAVLSQKGHKTAAVLMSHGEGGRLLQVNEKGEFVERYDVPKEKLVGVRGEETANAAKLMGVEVTYLYPPEANVDFGKTLECEEALETWNDSLTGGVSEMLRKLVIDIRKRRPRVIITHDPRNDSHWMDHGHNKAIGALVEAAARMAADGRYDGGWPHTVEEVVNIAPAGVHTDVSVPVGVPMRRKVLALYPSQFRVDKASEASMRSTEDYVLVWRAKGAPTPAGGTLLGELTK
jgi:LmbE family N-acetylglucosaminyl deacetylase